jgi:hypothetical protein
VIKFNLFKINSSEIDYKFSENWCTASIDYDSKKTIKFNFYPYFLNRKYLKIVEIVLMNKVRFLIPFEIGAFVSLINRVYLFVFLIAIILFCLKIYFIAFGIGILILPVFVYYDFILQKKFNANKEIVTAKVVSKKKIYENDTDLLELEIKYYYYSVAFKGKIKESTYFDKEYLEIYIDKFFPFIYSNSFFISNDIIVKYSLWFLLIIFFITEV